MSEETKPDLFVIDKHNLDEEWVSQASKFYKAAQRLAYAREDWERAKAKRDVVDAEVSLELRRVDPKKHGVTRLTEEHIKRLVLLDKRYQEANDQVISSRLKLDLYQAKVDALDQRKYGIQDLVRLHLQEYFAEPHVRGTPKVERKMNDAKADAAFGKRKEQPSIQAKVD